MNDPVLRVVVGLGGAAAICWNLFWLWRNRRVLTTAATVEGTIERVPVTEERLQRLGVLFKYVVRYRIGEDVFQVWVPPRRYVPGERVIVRYVPEAPGEPFVGGLPERLFGPLFTLFWGVTLVVWAVAM